jgi:hypothetical protein
MPSGLGVLLRLYFLQRCAPLMSVPFEIQLTYMRYVRSIEPRRASIASMTRQIVQGDVA